MAPDLNTVPPSPRNGRQGATSRISEPMAPPPIPSTTFSNHIPRETGASLVSSPSAPAGDNTGVGTGPGTDEQAFYSS